MTSGPTVSSVRVGAGELTTAVWGDGAPEIVLLHDGLGSIAQWRSVPAAIAERTGMTVLAYDRPGHGRSTPVPTGPWPTDWLHREADVLAALLDTTGACDPVLVGHSDGGSIALLHAAAGGGMRCVVTLAAHARVEPVCVERIAAMRIGPAPIIAGLARHHAEPVALFEAWSGVWTSDEFGRWDIRPLLGAITVPTVAVQGEADEYATPEHVAAIAEAIGPDARSELLPGLGHLLHHDDPDAVVALVADAVRRAPPPKDPHGGT